MNTSICDNCTIKGLCNDAGYGQPTCDRFLPKSGSGTIKDSGDRTTFETGAVRDMQGGKGRFDLMPLESVADLIRLDDKPELAEVIEDINLYIQNRDPVQILEALRAFADMNFGIHTYPLIAMLLDVAKHYEEGAKKYGPDNWRKGIPESSYIDSALRHLMKHCSGWTDEPHDRAFVWNLLCLYWEDVVHCKKEEV